MERLKGHCDICTKPDGEREHNLQQCKVCSVLVHELCYGMPPTTSKNPDFVCHACKAVGQEIEVNDPSRLGGWLLRDVLAQRAGAESFREYLREEEGESNSAEKGLDFYLAASDFHSNKDDEELFEDPLKVRAQGIFDTFCAKDAPKKIEVKPEVLSEIETTIFSDGGSNITATMFNAARQEVLLSLQWLNLGKYKQSATFKAHLASRRKAVKQEGRPTMCALCNVSTGIHAMHPLYDFDGKEGRQLLLPATGVGIKRKEERLEWVHSLCAMFICASGRTGGLVYGCDEQGDWEMPDDAEDEERSGSGKVIGRRDGKEEDPLALEQLRYTKCEETFEPLMERLQNVDPDNGDAEEVLECLKSMIDAVELLTPPFVRESQIGLLIKKVRKSFKAKHPEVKARCNDFSAKMKEDFHRKDEDVPPGFKPIKHANAVVVSPDGGNSDDDGNDVGVSITSGNAAEQKYPVGTPISKEFTDGTHLGEIKSYNDKDGIYRVEYDDADAEDLDEAGVSALMLASTAWFCMAAPNNGEETPETKLLAEHRELLVCAVCNVADTGRKCKRIAVQCNAGDRQEFGEFKKFHKALSKKKRLAKTAEEERHKTCGVAMHVGCARWKSDYAKVKGKSVRMCYYFPGQTPWSEPDVLYTEPVANCFCRVHAREIIEGQLASSARKRKSVDATGDSMSDYSSGDNDYAAEEKIRARKKKRRLLPDDSDDE